jgi:hypothetical protein
MMRARAVTSLAFVTLLAAHSAAAASNELLLRAEGLYKNAEYEEALLALDQMATDPASADYVEASEYRVFCLIALDRKDDARRALETLVLRDPFYQMRTGAAPRVRALFTDVRQAVLPALVQRTYADAKAAYDRRDPAAATAFERVIELLDDPVFAAKPELADLRIVTAGFRDLSKAFAPAPAASAVPTPPAAGAVASEPAVPAARVAYRDGDAGVVAPVPVNQSIPAFTLATALKTPLEGAVEVLIDESGTVVSAGMSVAIHPRYDQQLTRAATSWKYIPAQKDGKAVPFRKIVRVRIVPD